MASDLPPKALPALTLPMVLELPFPFPIASAMRWISLSDKDIGFDKVVISLITDFVPPLGPIFSRYLWMESLCSLDKPLQVALSI
jgi:hypothetical protein